MPIERWQRVIETLPQIVLTATADGAFDYVGPQLARYSGLAPSALVGATGAEVADLRRSSS